jgi:hypothetical protein
LDSLKPNSGKKDLSDPAEWKNIPGLTNIPVCDWSTWEKNHNAWGIHTRKTSKDPPCPHYPCCSEEELKEASKSDE